MRLKPRTIISAAAALCALAVLAITLFRDTGGPRYAGKSLSGWISNYEPVAFQKPFRVQVRADPARPDVQAVRAIGTNALPFLLDWIRYEPPPRLKKQVVLRRLERLPRFIFPDRLRNSNFWKDSAEVRAQKAEIGFMMLGEVAHPAIPQLRRFLCASTNAAACARTVSALVGIGPTALPALRDLMKGTNEMVRGYATSAMFFVAHEMGTNAVPVLIDCLDDSEPGFVIAVGHSLAMLRAEPTVVLSKLTNYIDHTEWRVRANAITTASEYGELARFIIPELTKALTDKDPDVRNAATNALSYITTAVLIKTRPN